MLSKFRGKCATCGGAIEAGTEIDYEAAAKKAHHKECRQPESGGEDIAIRLDYRTAEELAGDWDLLFLRWSTRNGSVSAERSNDSAQGDRDSLPSLFEEN